MEIARHLALGLLLLACQSGGKETAIAHDAGDKTTDRDAGNTEPVESVTPSTSDTPQENTDASAPAPGSSEGLSDGAVDLTPAEEDPSAMQVCREYFETICSRIRQCGAPTYRPCESPPDLCPDILFASGSTWMVEEVVACTETWKTHDCQMLANDTWPPCSARHGTRPNESSCVFDAQCASGSCVGGIVPLYDAACGSAQRPYLQAGRVTTTTRARKGWPAIPKRAWSATWVCPCAKQAAPKVKSVALAHASGRRRRHSHSHSHNRKAPCAPNSRRAPKVWVARSSS